mgnify:CR=1 FL=1
MTMQNKPELDFLATEPLSLRAIDQTWIKNRAVELGCSDIQGALEEAVGVLYERIGPNAKDAPAMVFTPGNDTDPYIVAIPLDHLTNRERGQSKGMPPVAERPDVKHSTLRDEFENLLFESGSFDPSITKVDDKGRYVVLWVRARWEGFQMYHTKLTIESSDSYKPKYAKTLGRYVIGKVAPTGAVLFHKVPFRHQTKALALEEANRLSADFDGAFAIYRCLDIIDVRPVVKESADEHVSADV